MVSASDGVMVRIEDIMSIVTKDNWGQIPEIGYLDRHGEYRTLYVRKPEDLKNGIELGEVFEDIEDALLNA